MRRTMADAYAATIEGLTPERFVGARAPRDDRRRRSRCCSSTCCARPQLTRSFMEMSLRDPQVAELRRAFEQVAVASSCTS